MGAVAAPTMLEPKRVDLGSSEWLMLGLEGGGIAGAYYRLRRPDEPKDLPAQRRFANRRGSLEALIGTLFLDGESRHHAGTVVDYIRSTPWGEQLP